MAQKLVINEEGITKTVFVAEKKEGKVAYPYQTILPPFGQVIVEVKEGQEILCSGCRIEDVKKGRKEKKEK